MGAHILKEGWDNWKNPANEKTVLYAEYNSKGIGADISSRVKWSKQLTKIEEREYTLNKIFAGKESWIPSE